MKRVFTLFLALMMVVGCMTILPLTASAAEAWDGSSTAPEGTGTKADPYLIDSAADLAWLASHPTNGAQTFQCLGFNHEIWEPTYTKYENSDDPQKYVDTMSFLEAPYIYIKQTADIDLNGRALTSICSYFSCFGQGQKDVKGQFFHGSYDGQGYAIKNGSIKAQSTNHRWVAGLFGYVWGADIRNINFENVEVTGNSGSGNKGFVAATVIGPQQFAKRSANDFGSKAMVYNMLDEFIYVCDQMGETTIENIYVDGNCTLDAYAGAKNQLYSIGGIVGEANNTVIRNCTNCATMYIGRNCMYVGGIAGMMSWGSVIDSNIFAGEINNANANVYNYETHIGGIVGSWRTVYAASYIENARGVSQGHGAIINNKTFGALRLKGGQINQDGKAATLCVGGTLGAGSCLYTAGTDSTYTIDGNIVAVAEWCDNATRMGAVVGCFYTNRDAAPTYDRNAWYNIITINNNIANDAAHPKAAGSGYPLKDNLFTVRTNNQCSDYCDRSTHGQTGHVQVLGALNSAVGTGNMMFYGSAIAEYPVVKMALEDLWAQIFDGEGTAENPYKISSVYTWKMMWRMGCDDQGGREFQNTKIGEGKYFVQTADLDLKDVTYVRANYHCDENGKTATFKGHTYLNGQLVGDPTVVNPTINMVNVPNDKGIVYSGNYDGQGYTIANASIQKLTNNNGNWASGLFGIIYGATIKNLVLDNIHGESSTSIGVLAGAAYSDRNTYYDMQYTVTNSGATSMVRMTSKTDKYTVYEGFNTVENVVATNCSVKNNLDGAVNSCGGLIGVALGLTIDNCYVDVDVTHNGEFANGIGGLGGVVGSAFSSFKMTNTIFAGEITVVINNALSGEMAVGGLVGLVRHTPNGTSQTYSYWKQSDRNTFVMENCVNVGTFNMVTTDLKTLNTNLKLGGLIGETNDLREVAYITNCHNLADVVLPEDFVVPANKQLRIAGLIGTCFISGGASGQSYTQYFQITDSYTVKLTTKAVPNNANVDMNATDGVIQYSTRFAADGGLAARLTDSGVADTDAEIAAMNEAVNAILNTYKDSKGVKVIDAVTDADDRGRMSVNFIVAVDAAFKAEDVKAVYGSVVVTGDADRTVSTEGETFYTTYKNQAGEDCTAPEGFTLLADATVNNLSNEKSYELTVTVTILKADGSKATQAPVVYTVVNGVATAK